MHLYPSAAVLQWLSAGQLLNRISRSVRLWYLLHWLYDNDACYPALPQPFGYADLRDRLFHPNHHSDESLKPKQMMANCPGSGCICQRSLQDLVFKDSMPQPQSDWIADMTDLTGLPPDHIRQYLDSYPFATVHRSIRDDLKSLVAQGWLTRPKRGQFHLVPAMDHPTPPPLSPFSSRSFPFTPRQTWSMLHALEAVAFAQPNLEPIIQTLWESLHSPATTPAAALPSSKEESPTPIQRIFIDLDYILTEECRERVDTLQADIEDLWQQGNGVVQFDYWRAKAQQQVTVVVYPVCLHYTRRAKYLSAYGRDPDGQVTWHNYRLDRIRSARMTVLAWGDRAIPDDLKTRRNTGTLPTPDEVRHALDQAWGFNFYLPRALLIMRFPQRFAQDYVNQTVRHPTFGAIAFADLPQLIRQHIPTADQQPVLDILGTKAPDDAYYQGWIRVGDINTTMRLRQWRPNGEVIAPLEVRSQMQQEAMEELALMQSFQSSPQ